MTVSVKGAYSTNIQNGTPNLFSFHNLFLWSVSPYGETRPLPKAAIWQLMRNIFESLNVSIKLHLQNLFMGTGWNLFSQRETLHPIYANMLLLCKPEYSYCRLILHFVYCFVNGGRRKYGLLNLLNCQCKKLINKPGNIINKGCVSWRSRLCRSLLLDSLLLVRLQGGAGLLQSAVRRREVSWPGHTSLVSFNI